MKHQTEWLDMDTGEHVCFAPTEQTDDLEAYLCPKCGKPCEYWEGQIDEDPMGGTISGWAYDCWECHIHSTAAEC